MIVMGIGGIAAPISAAARAAGAASILFNGIDAPRPKVTGLKYPDVSATGDIVLWGVNFTYPTRPKLDRKSTRLNSSHSGESRMPSSA